MSGYSTVWGNIGETSNKGIEFTINSTNIVTSSFSWKTTFTISANRNKIEKLYGDNKDDITNKWFIGKSLFAVYDYKLEGVWQEGEDPSAVDPSAKPGDLKFADINKDGKITADDRIYLGTSLPKYIAGLSNTFTYKNFSLSIFIQANQGGLKGDAAALDVSDQAAASNLPKSIWWAYQLYETQDVRNSKYNIRRQFIYNDPANANYGKVMTVNGTDTLFKNFVHTTKWYFYDPKDEFGYVTKKDHIMMRFGETYLLLAEAQIMQNKLSDAMNNINIIRNRVNATPITDPQSVTLDLLLDERARELIGEEERRLTLVRTGKLLERTKKYNPTLAATSIQDYNVLLPIPQTQIDLNKGAVLEQNPGY